jgi:hypothetical protein
MFERKFEFTVYHSLEVCEERVLDMGKSGCVPSFLYPISSEVFSMKGYSENYVRRSLTRHNIVEIKAVIEEVDSGTSKISGTAIPKGFLANIVYYFILAEFLTGMLATYSHDWHIMLLGTGFSLIIAVFVALDAVRYRNRLISKLENALNQPKKKNQY